ncbi:hypothetical protein [Petroclostridium sp. X23]|uniref:hypothetical protein n=1 Tax=Petroclostridium sp. X23 TaxID=3045146 RepID=UPI0024ADA8D1|nr:hypothetical protein [Petroclostridium sp. X23]WHH59106.1 hypothetical protein QKW49_25525 [Petroclostridium sp. X23]
MLVTISIMSKKRGEIKKFLDKYFDKETDVDDSVIEWIYVYRNVIKAMNIIDVVMDNISDYNISLWVQLGDEDIVEVNSKNKHKIIDEIANTLEVAASH